MDGLNTERVVFRGLVPFLEGVISAPAPPSGHTNLGTNTSSTQVIKL